MTTFTWAPAPGARQTKAPRVATAQFGDGYQQRAQRGINNTTRVWELEFPRETLVIDAIEDFLSARAAVESFAWTPPKGPAGRWLCKTWSQEALVGTDQTLTATFEEVFGD